MARRRKRHQDDFFSEVLSTRAAIDAAALSACGNPRGGEACRACRDNARDMIVLFLTKLRSDPAASALQKRIAQEAADA